MNAKRIVQTMAAGVVVVVAALVLHHLTRPAPPTGLQLLKIHAAAVAYAEELRARGAPVPQEVSSSDLLARGSIDASDLGNLEGIEVRIRTGPVELSRPQDPLARVLLPDGGELTLLGDGSVQQRLK